MSFVLIMSCGGSKVYEMNNIDISQLENSQIRNYSLLECMYEDAYFPEFLVDKCHLVLINLCHQIEVKQPEKLEDLYELTHTATRYINDLEDEFFANGSEIETVARECLGMDIYFISKAYGFDADVEELIATRRW